MEFVKYYTIGFGMYSFFRHGGIFTPENQTKSWEGVNKDD